MLQPVTPPNPAAANEGLDAKFAALRAPFPESQIRWRVGARTRDKQKGQAIPYIDARDVQRRLDDVFGPHNWKPSFVEVADGVLCRLAIRCGAEWVVKEDVSSIRATSIDSGDEEANHRCDAAIKGAYSDAFKRAGVMWGIGRYLYRFDPPWVALRDGKYLAHTPRLPLDFLPEDERLARLKRKPGSRPAQASVVTNSEAQLQESAGAPASSAQDAMSATTPVGEAAAQAFAPEPVTEESREAASSEEAEASTDATNEVAQSAPAEREEDALPPLIGSDEQWTALTAAQQATVGVLIERIRKGVALHSIEDYLTTGRGKDLPEWLRAGLLKQLAERLGTSLGAVAA